MMRRFSFYPTLLMICFLSNGLLYSQYVGIGTTAPSKLLTVKGSILLDAANQNPGSPDSAALLFGTATKVGISSCRAGGSNMNGLDFWTNNLDRLTITQSGAIGINTTSPSYTLDITGNSRVTGNFYANSALSIGSTTYGYGNAYFYQNLYAADQVGIGTSPTTNYKLKVECNGYFSSHLQSAGNLTVGGTSNLQGKLTNEGKGIMLSNSTTTLRSGFTSGTFSLTLNPGATADVTFFVTSFTGNNNNIRVMISQFVPGSGANNYGGVVYTPHDIIAADPNYSNQSTVKIRMQNTSSSIATLGNNAILYLYSVVTN